MSENDVVKTSFTLRNAADVIVNYREAESLFAASNKTQTECILLDHVGHLYNAASPGEDHYHTINGMLDSTTHWLQQKLT